ncbi:ABC transporter substrate-binding protein [Zwartia panacis]|jgi:polar amino acid transport system substrate-binding protein|uniref:ABC transporter substrate-binding protein n=1 Tax=Zwartia panacis TaxID=2683345 RepID=UPI0025B566CD|nr:ABC transporter substrate-binding protein [Zwartia panacis]MDN4018170.1 ABC transporter substrate-binding protein [Zwartia panacis]
MSQDLLSQIAPTGKLRAGINLLNFLLVTGKSADGMPEGVAPDMARAIAEKLGVPLELVPYATPGELADAALDGAWDIGLIGSEPARAEKIDFTAAYVEIEATYLVPAGSTLRHASEVDQPGNRIAVASRSAYDLWLVRNIKHATLMHADGFEATLDLFLTQKLEAMASLKPGLLNDVEKVPGSRILEGKFTAVQQSVGVPKGRTLAAQWLQEFVQQAKASGFVAELIAKHHVKGLSVAP